MVAMAGQAAPTTIVLAALKALLRGRDCEIYRAAMRVKVAANGLHTCLLIAQDVPRIEWYVPTGSRQ